MEYRHFTLSNNWLKMHGYPIRRKMHNAKRRRNRKQTRHKKTYPVVVSVAGEGIHYEVDRKP